MKSLLRLPLFIGVVCACLVVAGCNTSTKKKDFDVTVARFVIEASVGDAFASVTLPVSGVQIAVNNKPVVTEFDYVGVKLARSDLGQFMVFILTPEAARDVYRITASNQGKRLVLFINDKPVGARMIDRPFNTGAIEVFAAIPDDLLAPLVKNLNATSEDLQKQLEKAKK
ncbi:MAG: hypothetical protein WC205_03245 [Opitutaceae bacterium]|jgi:hypothetical protein